MKKRVLAIMLACLMMVTALPMGAMAGENKCPVLDGTGTTHNVNNCSYEVVEVVKPTCGTKEYGYTLYECTVCAAQFADNFVQTDAKNHNWTVVGGTSCVDGGKRVCTLCDAEENAHKFPEKSESCDAARVCEICGSQEVDENGKPIAGKHTWAAEPTKILVAPNELTFESGWALYECTVCEATGEIEILPHDCGSNSTTVWVMAKAGSCTENGYVTHKKCTVCNAIFISKDGFYTMEKGTEADIITKPAGHTAPEGTVNSVDPTCTTTGLRSYICTVCGETIVDEVVPVKHDYIKLEQNSVPVTCTTYGYTISICANPNCPDGTYIETIKPTGHSKKPENAVKVEATCSQNAYYMWVCENDNCSSADNIAKEEIANSKLGHKIASKTYAATCEQYAYTIYFCERGADCDSYEFTKQLSYKYNKDLNENGKIDEDEKNLLGTIVLDTEYALITSLCAVKWTAGFSKTNHVVPDGSTIVEPTCTTAGKAAFYCTNCNVFAEVVIPAKGHVKGEKVEVAATCQAAGYKGYTCSNDCGTILEATPIAFVAKDVYDSLDDAKAAHPCVTAWTEYTSGSSTAADCQKTTYYVGVCAAVNPEGKSVGCGKTVRAKNANTGAHQPAIELGEKPDPIYGYVNPVEPMELPAGLDLADYAIFVADGYDYDNFEYIYVEVTLEQFLTKVSYENGVLSILTYSDLDFKLVPLKAEFAGKAPTCTENGYTAQFVCKHCGELIESITYISKEESADGKEHNVELKALGHNKINAVSAIEPTCTTAGRTEGFDCTVCKISVKSEVLEATGHDWRWGSVVTTDDYSCRLNLCLNCGLEAVVNYKSICHHEWAEDRDQNVLATCEKAGKIVYVCELCGVKKEVATAKVAHKTDKGVAFFSCNLKEKTDCAICKKSIDPNPAHTFGTPVVVAADCVNYGYTTKTCTECGHAERSDVVKPAGHKYELIVTYKDPAKKDEIVSAVNKCSVCNDVQKVSDNVQALIFNVEIANAVGGAKANISDGSLVKVTIKASGLNAAMWGVRMDLNYSANLTFVNASSASSEFIAMANGNVNASGVKYVSLYAQANGSDDVAVDGEVALIDLYFRVNKAERNNKDEKVAVSIANADVRSSDNKALLWTAKAGEAKTAVLMELDGEAGISVGDVLAAYNLLASGKYNAAADLNKNGVIDAEDMAALYNFFIGATDYAKTVALGIAKK